MLYEMSMEILGDLPSRSHAQCDCRRLLHTFDLRNVAVFLSRAFEELELVAEAGETIDGKGAADRLLHAQWALQARKPVDRHARPSPGGSSSNRTVA